MEPQEEITTRRCGAYSEVTELHDDPRLQEVVEFVVKQFRNGDNNNTNPLIKKYSFASYLSSNHVNYGAKVLEAHRQVVAGLNWKLVLTVHDDDHNKCIGKFSVIVYQHFSGTLQVTDWGDEIQVIE